MSPDRLDAPPPGVEWVEIKVTLGPELVDRGLAAFSLDKGAAERRRIWFCEHLGGHRGPKELPLLARGVILRVRKRADHADDATLKLRGPEGCIDPELWQQRTRAFGKQARIEGDWVADRHLLSASLDGDVEGGRIDEVVAERPHRVRRLLSEAQEALASDWLLGLGELEPLGPVQAWKWQLGADWLDGQDPHGAGAFRCAILRLGSPKFGAGIRRGWFPADTRRVGLIVDDPRRVAAGVLSGCRSREETAVRRPTGGGTGPIAGTSGSAWWHCPGWWWCSASARC